MKGTNGFKWEKEGIFDNAIFSDTTLFDRYTGLYIPDPDAESDDRNEYENTTVTYEDNSWDISAYSSLSGIRTYQPDIDLGNRLEDAKNESNVSWAVVRNLYVTYPEEYDDLCFLLGDINGKAGEDYFAFTYDALVK